MSLAGDNSVRWSQMKVANAQRWADALVVAKKIYDHKDQYIEVADGVRAEGGDIPWWVIGVIHDRECSLSFACNLAQGDRWDRASIHVPKGQGPFTSFKQAGVNALMRSAPYAGKNRDWSPGGTLAILEKYNGLGYFNGPMDRSTGHRYQSQASPYIWAGTNQYLKGKYVSDGKFDPNYIDKQLGVALVIKALMYIDKSIKFSGGGSMAEGATTFGVIGPAGVAAQQAHASGMHWAFVVGILVVGIAIAVASVYFINKSKKAVIHG